MDSYQEIIDFWFEEIDQSNWFKKSEEFDNLLIDRFSDLHSRAVKCELFLWRKDPLGALAEIIILDQFSRNIFRDTPLSFAYDSMALTLSQEAIAKGFDKKLTQIQRSFLYMPFMHSESLEIHRIALDLYKENGLQNNLDYEIKHMQIIEKFGRYPHRNEILGRESSDEELEFLKGPNSSF